MNTQVGICNIMNLNMAGALEQLARICRAHEAYNQNPDTYNLLNLCLCHNQAAQNHTMMSQNPFQMSPLALTYQNVIQPTMENPHADLQNVPVNFALPPQHQFPFNLNRQPQHPEMPPQYPEMPNNFTPALLTRVPETRTIDNKYSIVEYSMDSDCQIIEPEIENIDIDVVSEEEPVQGVVKKQKRTNRKRIVKKKNRRETKEKYKEYDGDNCADGENSDTSGFLSQTSSIDYDRSQCYNCSIVFRSERLYKRHIAQCEKKGRRKSKKSK